MFIGSQEQVQGAFADAGWSQASKLGEKSKLETLRAIAEDRGYSEAPVSILYLDGRPPEMVFEKLNNTFSKRHHLRIWLRPDRYQGQPVCGSRPPRTTLASTSRPRTAPSSTRSIRRSMWNARKYQRLVADRQGAIAVDGGPSQCAAARAKCDGRQFEYGRQDGCDCFEVTRKSLLDPGAGSRPYTAGSDDCQSA
jgi:hypothetical protein